MSCNPSHVRLNSLESIWYCNLAVVITVFLVFDGNRRYHQYVSLPWPDQDRPTAELRLYLCLIIMATLLITAFIPTQYFKVGNHANDQSKLGAAKRKRKKKKDTAAAAAPTADGPTAAGDTTSKEDDQGGGEDIMEMVRMVVRTVRSCRRHLGPIGATIHITSAFCLLLPVVFLQARAIQFGILPPEMIWRSEVGEIFLVQDPSNFTYFHIHTTSSLEYQSLLPTGSAMPPLQHSSPSTPSKASFSAVVVTINYLNYVVPLFLYAIRYADVFWACHKGFALLISLQLMMNAVQYALGFIGMSLLYKLHSYGWEKYDMDSGPVFSSAPVLIPAYLINNITVFVAAAILYLYGYGRLKRVEFKRTRSHDAVPIETIFVHKWKGYLPQVAALCALLVFIACKTPFMLEYLSVYRFSRDGRMLCCVIFDALYIVLWLLLWVFLTVKQHWAFRHMQPDEEGLYTRGQPLYCKDVLEPVATTDKTVMETELHSPKISVESDSSDRSIDKHFPNGYLQLTYSQNGDQVDKYVKVRKSDVSREARPHSATDLPEGDPTQDRDVNIFSNPLSSG